ncbi:MAG: DUF397 domain-containing protein [Acidimicrobiales bacterium]
MGHHDLAEFISARWRTSSFTDRGSCVAVAACRNGSVAVRNSNDPDAGTVTVSVRAMHDWIAGIKAGEFDDLS